MEANRDLAVGVIGLGNMGSGVAARLVEFGFPVLGFGTASTSSFGSRLRTALMAARVVAPVAIPSSTMIATWPPTSD